ncbi:MAG: ComF family protein [Chloroflexi bacterium]|nr:ComF family protein [Chloroflexota bacterium]
MLRGALADAAATLVPPICAGCGSPGAWLCLACRTDLDPLTATLGAMVVRAAGAHAGPLRTAIHRFKYRQERALARELGSLIAMLLAQDLAHGIRIDALVPVALHPERARWRGYDQAGLLADAAGMHTGLPVIAALHRIRHATPQVDLDRAERERNVDGAFVSTAGALRGASVALVDDVTTTGATLQAAARAVRAAGARRIRAYVVAADE